jgi:hypothetical protein
VTEVRLLLAAAFESFKAAVVVLYASMYLLDRPIDALVNGFEPLSYPVEAIIEPGKPFIESLVRPFSL